VWDAADFLPFGSAVERGATCGKDPINSAWARPAFREPRPEFRLLLRRDVGDGVAFPELLPVRQVQPRCLCTREVLRMVVPIVQQNAINQDFVWRLAVLALVRDNPLREFDRCGLKV